MTDHTAHRTGWRITTCPNCREEYARGLDPLRPEGTDQDLTDGTKHALGVLAVSGLFLVLALVVVGLAALIGGNE